MCGKSLADKLMPVEPPPTCLPELRRALLDEWCNIPQDQIDNLILSMARLFEIHLRDADRLAGDCILFDPHCSWNKFPKYLYGNQTHSNPRTHIKEN
ncbi:hypothetical protein TNCV_4005611 [Trichonephila clavipes]|nr:hypothetical protein TNCV_4005611 [Trichonephila clavipes]